MDATPEFSTQTYSHACGWFCLKSVEAYIAGGVLGPESIPKHADVIRLLSLIEEDDYAEPQDKQIILKLKANMHEDTGDFTYNQRLYNRTEHGAPQGNVPRLQIEKNLSSAG